MWGIVPAAGRGTRIQPLAFSKELLPLSGAHCNGGERPRAVSEYLLDRMLLGGVDRICMVIAPDKTDILSYYGADYGSARMTFVVQPKSSGLCDAVFRASHLIAPGEGVVIGLPDTIWFPERALASLPDDRLSCLLFPVDDASSFDAVVLDQDAAIERIEVKAAEPHSNWIWGAIKMPGRDFLALHDLWLARGRQDEYLGTLINAWLGIGNMGVGVKAGESYIDVGTIEGYRRALGALDRRAGSQADRGIGEKGSEVCL